MEGMRGREGWKKIIFTIKKKISCYAVQTLLLVTYRVGRILC